GPATELFTKIEICALKVARGRRSSNGTGRSAGESNQQAIRRVGSGGNEGPVEDHVAIGGAGEIALQGFENGVARFDSDSAVIVEPASQCETNAESGVAISLTVAEENLRCRKSEKPGVDQRCAGRTGGYQGRQMHTADP